MDGQHSLCSDAVACLSDVERASVIDTLDLLHVAGSIGKAAKKLCRSPAELDSFLRERLLRIGKSELHAVIRGAATDDIGSESVDSEACRSRQGLTLFRAPCENAQPLLG